MGEGIGHYETFFNCLKEIGYQGYVGDEMCAALAGGGDIENLGRTAEKFLDYVRKF
jgi:hydroxypyruvate isomerase